MKNLLENTALRGTALLLTIVVSAIAFWSGLFTLSNWNDLWLGGNYYESSAISREMHRYTSQIEWLAELQQNTLWGDPPSYMKQQHEQELLQTLNTQNTNFRFQLHTQAGESMGGNLETGRTLEEQVYQVTRYTFHVSNQPHSESDTTHYDERNDTDTLTVYTDLGPLAILPEEANQAIQYGWFYQGDGWYYDSSLDSRYKTQEFVLEYGVSNPLTVHDNFWTSQEQFNELQQWLPGVATLALVAVLATIALLVFDCSAAGRRRGVHGYVPSWQERIPLDLYLTVQFFLLLFLMSGGDQITYSFNQNPSVENVVGLAILSLLLATLMIATILTLTLRLKTHTFLRSTLVWRICVSIGRGAMSIVRDWPMAGRAGICFLLYLFGSVITTLTIVLIPFYQGAILLVLLRWVRQWRDIRAGAAQIVGGEPDFKINTDHMFSDLKAHAEQLNDLGAAIGNAVDERMRSERFKSELITNVSHDLKTPLTSIINYVDLLKKLQVENKKAAEYIEVLDRKSQRLKKLTEDLVEASKASTGNLTVCKERLGLVQLVQQALAEYDEKFQQQHLELVHTLPSAELYVNADGRHLWRIIDNLLSNCYKYAMKDTRVYLDVGIWDSNVVLSVKNISRQQLNLPADQLMERFVRGEESRSTEGSGLGLSIARSLTELQGGIFRLDIDGDLFKATVTFPLVTALATPHVILPAS